MQELAKVAESARTGDEGYAQMVPPEEITEADLKMMNTTIEEYKKDYKAYNDKFGDKLSTWWDKRSYPELNYTEKYPLVFTCVDIDKDIRRIGGNIYNPVQKEEAISTAM